MPHCEGCSERGPETLRVFSNCDMIRVIIPSACAVRARANAVRRARERARGARGKMGAGALARAQSGRPTELPRHPAVLSPRRSLARCTAAPRVPR
jgi:hypothetical protein